jgi:citrate synthase
MDSAPKTQIATSDEQSITVRGHDLVDDLMGKFSFTEFVYFLICHRFPTPGETQVAMAAGLLAVGSVFVGTMEGCGELLKRGLDRGGDLDAYCRDTVGEFRARKKAMPGFGHPIHKPDDPRVPRLFQIAGECGVKGDYIALLKRMSAELDRQAGRHLTINATGAIAALLLEIGLPPEIMRGIAVVSRAGGLTGHIVEERETHSGRHIWGLVEHAIPYDEPKGE